VVRFSPPKFRPANNRALRHSSCYRNVTTGVSGSKSPQGHPKVTTAFGKVALTTATSGKLVWQAGMSKLMNGLRSYVPLRVTKRPEYLWSSNEGAGKSEKHPWYPGMYKGMKSLPGYVGCRDRDNWDFRENSASNGKFRMVSQLPCGGLSSEVSPPTSIESDRRAPSVAVRI
jgi:hypothetical protein